MFSEKRVGKRAKRLNHEKICILSSYLVTWRRLEVNWSELGFAPRKCESKSGKKINLSGFNHPLLYIRDDHISTSGDCSKNQQDNTTSTHNWCTAWCSPKILLRFLNKKRGQRELRLLTALLPTISSILQPPSREEHQARIANLSSILSWGGNREGHWLGGEREERQEEAVLWDFVSSFLGFFARIITGSNPFTSATLL